MRLSEYLAARGQLAASVPIGNRAALHAFFFGEEYTVELMLAQTITSYRFDTLDEALDVFRSEFEADTSAIPNVQVMSYGEACALRPAFMPAFGPAAADVLVVTRVERNMMFAAPPIETFVEDISRLVTYYSISGSWDQTDRSNL